MTPTTHADLPRPLGEQAAEPSEPSEPSTGAPPEGFDTDTPEPTGRAGGGAPSTPEKKGWVTSTRESACADDVFRSVDVRA